MRGRRGCCWGDGAALQLTLTDAQKTTIQAELEGLKPDDEPEGEPRGRARKAVAEAVRSGKVNEAAGCLAQFAKPESTPPASRRQSGCCTTRSPPRNTRSS